MEDKKSLQASAVISQLPNTVKNKVHNLLANGVVATSIVVGCVFLWSKLIISRFYITSTPYYFCFILRECLWL